MPSPPNVLAGPLQSEVDRLLLIEDYGTAARLLRDAGELQRACELFERIREYREAASCAVALGDLPRALEAHLSAGDLVAAAQLTTRLREAAPADRLRGAAVLERRRRFEAAASLYESAGELAQAANLYRRAGEPLQAARLWEQQGRLREAVTDYERAIAEAAAAAVPTAPGRAVAPSADAGKAELGLGRTLRSFGRAIEAVLPLQAAVRAPDPAVRRAARWLLVRALAEMQLRAGAKEALRMLRADLTSEPVEPPAFREHDLEAFLRLPLPPLAAPAGHAPVTPGGATSEGGTPAATEGAAPLLGGRYRLERLLGAGSTGRVYRAMDLLAERPVALKLLTPPEPSRARDRYQRFVREARVIAGLRHPNIVPILDANEDLGLLAMELMEGGTLASRLGQRLDPHVVVGVVQGMAAALQVAHQRGIVHRDLKPENVFVGGAGDVKLGDFGVAHLIDLGETQTAGFIGSLAYMSPEQITAAPVSAATDLYALGVTVFQLLTGRLPFLGPDFVSEHLSATPPLVSEVCAGLDPAWDAILTRLLAKRSQDRFASTEELLLALGPIAERARAEARLRAPGTPIGGLSFPEPASLAAAAPAGPAPAAASTASGVPRWLERYGELRPAGPLSDAAIGAGLQLWQGTDPGLGCAVRLEVWPPDFASSAEGRVHLERLRVAAGQVLPGVELVLGLEQDDRGTLLVFEELDTAAAPDPGRSLPPDRALERLLVALAPLHTAGIAHGLIDVDSLVLTADGPVLRWSGRLPPGTGTPRADLQDLEAAWRARGLTAAPLLAVLQTATSASEALERLRHPRAAGPHP